MNLLKYFIICIALFSLNCCNLKNAKSADNQFPNDSTTNKTNLSEVEKQEILNSIKYAFLKYIELGKEDDIEKIIIEEIYSDTIVEFRYKNEFAEDGGRFIGDYMNFDFKTSNFIIGDLNGDNINECIVQATYEESMNSVSSDNLIFILKLNNSHYSLDTFFFSRSIAPENEYSRYFDVDKIEDGVLVGNESYYEPGSARCCPKSVSIYLTHYSYKNKSLKQVKHQFISKEKLEYGFDDE